MPVSAVGRNPKPKMTNDDSRDFSTTSDLSIMSSDSIRTNPLLNLDPNEIPPDQFAGKFVELQVHLTTGLRFQ